MPPERQTFSIPGQALRVQVTDDESRTLIDLERGISYHSGSGAAAETEQVYLCNSGVRDRLSSGLSTSVLEIGLGVGMGLLLTIDEALASSAPLEYHAVEYQLLDQSLLQELHLSDLLRSTSLEDDFLEWRASLGTDVGAGTFRWQVSESIQVQLHHRDAREHRYEEGPPFDAIYFDPFDPRANPNLWNAGFLRRMQQTLKPEGRLVTYCVNRAVKDALREAGFRPRPVRGPVGGKREVMIATIEEESQTSDATR